MFTKVFFSSLGSFEFIHGDEKTLCGPNHNLLEYYNLYIIFFFVLEKVEILPYQYLERTSTHG